MQNYRLWALAATLTAAPALALTQDTLPYHECQQTAVRLNRQYPQTVDSDTKVTEVQCAASNRGYLVTFRMAINVRKEDVPDDALARLAPRIAAGACQDATLRPLIRRAPLAWKYYDRDDVYLGDVQVDAQRCEELDPPHPTPQ